MEIVPYYFAVMYVLNYFEKSVNLQHNVLHSVTIVRLVSDLILNPRAIQIWYKSIVEIPKIDNHSRQICYNKGV